MIMNLCREHFSDKQKIKIHILRLLLFLVLATATIYVVRGCGYLFNVRAAVTVQNSVPVVSVSAASFIGSPAALAPNSIVAAFGTQLSTGEGPAPNQPLPTTLYNTTVTVSGIPAQLFYVSGGQVNYLVPGNAPAGDAEVVITSTQGNGDQIVSRGQIKIEQTAPAIFTANSNGAGVPAAVTGRINDAGVFVFDSKLPFEPDPLHSNQWVPAPIEVGTDDRPAFLILYGTGFRNSAPGSTHAIIGGIDQVIDVAASRDYTGLDQANVPIPSSLKGGGIVDVTLVTNGISSNVVKINLAGTPNVVMAITGFSVNDPALVGQTVAINGNGFSSAMDQNKVRFGPAQARVIAAASNQLTVIIPFGAESGPVTVQNAQGEARSSNIFRIRTSVSGVVQSTGSVSAPPAPLENVTVRLVGTNISARTTPQGTFVMPDLPVGVAQIEVDGGTTNSNPPFPQVTLKATILGDRDNQFAQPISLQQISGGSGTVGGSSLSGESPISIQSSRVLAALKLQFPKVNDLSGGTSIVEQELPAPAKRILISDRGVTLEVPIGTSVKFPGGKTSGQMQLTVIEKSRLPGITIPVGVFSTAIAQITPLGSLISPGASLSFPNPDQSTLPPGAKVDLYSYNFQSGAFVKRGTGTVSADRSLVVSDGRVVDVASFWFAAAPSGVTTVTGRVVNGLGLPVARAMVSVDGHSATSDQNGGFNIRQVATIGSSQIQVDAMLPVLYGTPPRGSSSFTTVVVGGVTKVGTIALSNTNQPGVVLSPLTVNLKSNSPPAKVDLTLTQAAPSGGLPITLTSNDTNVVTVPASVVVPAGQTTASFNITRVDAGVASITSRATLSGTTTESTVSVTSSRAAPVLRGINPQGAAPGAKITINGTGLVATSNGNLISFVRNNDIIATIDPDDSEVVVDPGGSVSVSVIVPPISAGPVGIVAAVIDAKGVISDTSAAIGFTVLSPDTAPPVLVNVLPAQGKPRDQVTINGSGFSQTPSENLVVFRQGLRESKARIIRAAPSSLVVEVPATAINKGKAAIIVRRVASNGALSGRSNALDFTITSDPVEPPAPTLSTLVNVANGTSTGQNGDTIRATGSGFGTNFVDVRTGRLANDDPLLSLLLFYQNNRLVNYVFPIGATGGTAMTAIIPTGLSIGQTLVTTVTFDRETGFFSDESGALPFLLTLGSLLRLDEGEPNDSPDTATDVFLQTIVSGAAARDDLSELQVRFTNGTTEPLHDLFSISVDAPTNISFRLDYTQTGDLDLFILNGVPNATGNYRVIALSTNSSGTVEQLTGTLPQGKFLIAVGAFSGSSKYTLTITPGTAGLVGIDAENHLNFRQPLTIESRKP